MELFDRRSAPKRADTWFVYALVDSRSPDDIRYIGITNNPRSRLNSHIADSCGSRERGRKASWIRGLVKSGAELQIGLIAEGLSQAEASEEEVRLIAELRENGARLTNTTDGGFGGMAGATHDLVARSRIGAASSARKRTTETKSRLSETFRLAGPQANSTVGLKGVTYDAQRRMWSARITVDGRRIKIGRFKSPDEAGMAYDRAAHSAWGADCFLNFPDRLAS